jgi:NAD-dependent deacetylase
VHSGPVSDTPALIGPVAFFTGAGISVGAGLPTYRGAGGLYSSGTAQPPSGDDITSERLPALWERFRPRLSAYNELAPSRAHVAIAELESALPGDVVVITQNVDGLHSVAGSTRVLELHGSLRTVRCLDHGHEHALDEAPWTDGDVPRCPTCAGMCRPAIVLFGEPLPSREFAEAVEQVRRARTIVAVGTSAVVYPAAHLIAPERTAGASCLWVNPETPPPDPSWHWLQATADETVPTLAVSPLRGT